VKRKTRKMGPPRKNPKRARIHTTQAKLAEKPPYPLDTATLADLAHLITDAPPEFATIIFRHRVPRPGDNPRHRYERIVAIDVQSQTTRRYKRRLGEDTWHYEGSSAPPPETSPKPQE